MSQNASIPELKRNLFFSGQQLSAEDLTDLNLANRELRWLHNRALHSWGIGIGLEAKGERGDSVVTIGPGYAVDCLGRQIIVTADRSKTVPAVAGQSGVEAIYYLVTAYKDDAGVCSAGGSVRLGEEPLLDWRLPNELQQGRDIVLAKASIQNCRLSRGLSLAERRSARPSQQPYIYGGQAGASQVWEKWPDDQKPLGVLTRVDTSLAQFHTQPVYVAHLVGERFIDLQEEAVLLVGFAVVVDPAPNHFTLQVLLPNVDALQGDPKALEKLNSNWQVAWMGIEG